MSRLFAQTGGLFAQETDKEVQSRIFHLITIGPTTTESGLTFSGLQLVDSNYDIAYRGATFSKFPLKFSGVSVSTDGTIDKASITVANVSRTLMRELETYDGLAGCRVTVITVYEKFLTNTYTINEVGGVDIKPNTEFADNNACLIDEYTIDSYTANEQTIVFQLNAVVDFEIRVPRRRFTPFSCYWRFKSAECGYTGSHFTTCRKSLQECQERKNSMRFGGFPGVPESTRRIWL